MLEQNADELPPPPKDPPAGVFISRPRVTSILVALFAIWLCTFGQFTAHRIAIALEHPHLQLDNEEGALLDQTLQLRRGHLPYRPLNDYPYSVGTYPPLYLIAAAMLTMPDAPSLYGGRLISAGALVVLWLAISVTAWRVSRSVLAALIAAGIFIATFEVYSWSPYFRVDMLALASTLLGISMALSFRLCTTTLAAGAVLFACAFFTKQTSVAAPLALAATLAFHQRQLAAKFLFFYGAAVAIPFLLLTMLTRGQFFVHTVLYNVNRMNWADLVVWAKHVWRFYPWLLGLLLAALALPQQEITQKREVAPPPPTDKTSDQLRSDDLASTLSGGERFVPSSPGQNIRDSLALLKLYFLFSLLNFFALAKSGSAENYLLEPLAAAAILVAVAFGHTLRAQASQNSRHLQVDGVLAILLLCHTVHIARWAPVMFSSGKDPTAEDFRLASLVTQRLRSARGPVVSELAAYTVFAGKPVLFQPFIMSELARQHRWNETKFLRDIIDKRFSLIATTVDLTTDAYTDAFTPAMRQAIREHYVCAERLESGRLWRYYLFQPKTNGVVPQLQGQAP
ncbi:MAG: hypothetical protein ACP5UB_05970 [Candidatus Sumerlaeaceae bacterium]